jgi:hypothetical protein
VSQQDIDGARQKILDANKDAGSQELSKQLKTEGYLPLTETLATGDPLLTATPNAGSASADVTVSVAVTYSMVGAKQDAVKQLLEKDIKKKIDTTKQNILSNGLDRAVIRVTDKKPNGDTSFSLQAQASAGVQQDAEAIKKLAVGKKKGEVQALISARPGVKDVAIDYSPFWVYSTPGSVKKITVIFEQSNGTPGSR